MIVAPVQSLITDVLGYNRLLKRYSHQVHASDPHTAAETLLKISSLYSEEPETKTAVLETIGELNPTLYL